MGEIALGARVEDTVTGFRGTVTAKCLYLGGSSRYLVEVYDEDTGKRLEEWFEADRLRLTSA